ncbi:C39 family peptidase [Catenulispora subtropica]|uniref:Peptidase C39 family protein n=1 Tax=Catenulispora subtropica TaxID=450798 RepID=A0ABN2SZU1_9ACTN
MSADRQVSGGGVSRRAVLAGGAAAGAVAAGFAGAGPAAAKEAGAVTTPGASDGARVRFDRWTTWADFVSGRSEGALPLPGPRLGIVMGQPVGKVSYTDPYLNTTAEYEYATWTSPSRRLDFGATQLTAHWNADTPKGTFIKVELLATMEDGHQDTWVMGVWALGDDDIDRTSVNGQSNTYAEIDTDTWNAGTGHSMRSYKLRLTLLRRSGSHASPRVWQIGATASAVPNRTTVPATTPGPATGITLDVKPYAQNIHKGQYVQYGGGGEAWCSPTSTEMVVEFWGKGPTTEQLSWVDPAYADPSVDQAARYSYDYGYEGTGNWPFTCAYAASYGLDAMVVRLNSLHELEVLIAAGFPVVTSQSFTKAENGYYASDGHLWTVIGFDANGDVIVNDPASNSDSNVYTVYPRRMFETVWLRTTYTKANGSPGYGSGGIAYLIKPHDKALPRVVDPRNPSWPSDHCE